MNIAIQLAASPERLQFVSHVALKGKDQNVRFVRRLIKIMFRHIGNKQITQYDPKTTSFQIPF